MNKKSVLILALLFGAVSASFAQVGGEVAHIGKQLFEQTAKGNFIPGTFGKVLAEGAGAGLTKEFGGSVGNPAVTGTKNAVAGTGLESFKTPVVPPANKTDIATFPTYRSDFPYTSEFQERIEKSVAATVDDIQIAYYRIKKEMQADFSGPISEQTVVQLQQDYLFMREKWDFLKFQGEEEDAFNVRLRLAHVLQQGIDAQLAPAYAQLDKFIGKQLRYPRQSETPRPEVDKQFARFPAGIYVSEKMKYFKFLKEQQDFFDGITAKVPQRFRSGEAEKYNFIPALKTLQDKYGGNLTAAVYKNDRTLYNQLEDAIIFASVGAPEIHAAKGFNTLENKPGKQAIFEVPADLQRDYMDTVYERLDEFIEKNGRYPYFSADPAASQYVYNRVTQQLTDEARLHLAVRRCLAFPENSESGWLKKLAEEGKEMVGTRVHDGQLPAVTY